MLGRIGVYMVKSGFFPLYLIYHTYH